MVNRFISVALLVFLIDGLTKFLVLAAKPDQVLIEGILSLTYATNTGISFGLLTNQPIIPMLVSIAVLGGVMYYYKELPKEKTVQWGVALIFGGTLGNLTDRILHGFVIDFINFSFWPAFNVADSAITVGAVLVLYYLIKNEK